MARKQVTPQDEKTFEEELVADVTATRWKPGQSGNPAGRPRSTPLEDPDDAERTLTEILIHELRKGGGARKLAKNLISLANGSNARVPYAVQLSAATSILDRIEGRPRQMNINVGNDEPLLATLFRKLVEDTKALEGHQLPASALISAPPVIEAEAREITSD